MQSRFSVGDNVKVKQVAETYNIVYNQTLLGARGVIIEIDRPLLRFKVQFKVYTEWFTPEQIEKINPKKGIIMSLTSKVRELALTKEERRRRKYGVIDDCGKRTSEGTELLLDALFASNLVEIDKKLVEVEAADKAESK